MTTLPDFDPVAITAALADLLQVETIDTDLYRGKRKPGGRGRVFGGQVIAQALQSATLSTEQDRVCHSLHAYFMRAGNEEHPIIFRVVRDFDGGSFSTRRVIASQQGKPILNMAASFHRPEPGLHHQDPMPDVPDPDSLPTWLETRDKYLPGVPEQFRPFLANPRPVEFRAVIEQPWMSTAKSEPKQMSWFKTVAPLGDDMAMHRAVLAYASDMQLLGTCTRPHGKSWMRGELMTASLDHALWFHDDFRADEWLLYCTDSPWSGRARGMNRGLIYARDGRLVASVAQEGLIREITPKG
ncbi:MAG: acyl-CoA thioesterase II [Hyphomonadaceae bacterium]|jgi:acyl-CoA thioesterase-2|nr:acyl-CoA thioesterase II [Hyphomonadaceae bacterium]